MSPEAMTAWTKSDSSRIDRLGGLFRRSILRMPPCFCAAAGAAVSTETSNMPAAPNAKEQEEGKRP